MKDIQGFEGLYAVTEEGKVWAYPRTWTRKHGRPSSHKGMWMKLTKLQVGYSLVGLVDKDRVSHKKYVHYLVAETFLPKRLQVNHKNGIKTDNRVENLEWCTPSENSLHARQVLKIGVPKGEKHVAAKLTEKDVREMRELRKTKGLLYRELAEIYGVDGSVVSRIINHQYWTHVE